MPFVGGTIGFHWHPLDREAARRHRGHHRDSYDGNEDHVHQREREITAVEEEGVAHAKGRHSSEPHPGVEDFDHINCSTLDIR